MTDKTGEFIRVEPVLRTPDERKETERRAHSTNVYENHFKYVSHN